LSKPKQNLVKVLYFIYSKVTTCFGPYSAPSLGHKMNFEETVQCNYKINYIGIKFNEISLSL